MLRADAVFFPHQLFATYMTCLPFEEQLNYLLMVRVFTE